jgi:GTP pyrophosphokinase
LAFSPRLEDAFAFAHALHRDQIRKGSDVPYVSHLMGVAAIVAGYGGPEDAVIAALLHDAVEDQGGLAAHARIREAFGEQVAAIVLACSDTDVEPKPPWRARKERFIGTLADLPEQTKLVVAADKLHNATSMLRDYREAGEQLWDRFTAGPTEIHWYHTACIAALRSSWDHPILDELEDTVERLHGNR